MDEDIILIETVLGGGQAAFTQLVEKYQNAVYQLAYRMLGSTAEAADAAQEGFIRAYTHLDRYDRKRSFKTWLLSITANHCIDCIRQNRKLVGSLDDADETDLAWQDSNPSPEQSALWHEQQDQVQRSLAQLHPQDRMVVILRYWHDCSYEEIASSTDSTVSSVKSRLYRARLQLAGLLQPLATPEPLVVALGALV
jgi:RNA polymerase sigma-70 factor (ECF subfamily)